MMKVVKVKKIWRCDIYHLFFDGGYHNLFIRKNIKHKHMAKQELDYLRQVFCKFDTDNSGYLNADQFVNLINALAEFTPELSRVPDPQVSRCVFAYYNTKLKGLLSFKEVYNWWVSPNRFYYFGDKAGLVKKAYGLFKKYAVLNGDKGICYTEFESLLFDNQLDHDEGAFDKLDNDENGLMSFREFANWLGWF